jgi:hypothetical protein
LRDESLKKVSLGEKKQIARQYMAQGLKRDKVPAVHSWMERFYQHYNYERNHSSTCNLTPMSFWDQWKTSNVERVLLSEKERKVRFLLKVHRQQILKVEPADNANQREVSSLNWRGHRAPSNSNPTQTDGSVLIAQPAV